MLTIDTNNSDEKEIIFGNHKVYCSTNIHLSIFNHNFSGYVIFPKDTTIQLEFAKSPYNMDFMAFFDNE